MTTGESTVPSARVHHPTWWMRNRPKIIRGLGIAALQVFLTALVISFLVPTIWMVTSSFKASTEIFVHPIKWLPDEWQWRNYVEAATMFPLWQFFLNTVIVTGAATVGSVLSSAMVGYSFARLRWPGRDFVFMMVLATMMLPDVVLIVPRFIMFKNFGWIDTFLPLTVPFWFGVASFYIFLMRQFLRGIPMELEDAARIDGASRARTLFQILMPLSTPVLATVAVFSVLQHYNDFMSALIFLNSMEKWTLALAIMNYNSQYTSQWDWIFAVATMMFAPMLLLFIFAQRYFVKGITMTGFGGQ
ncbi:MAG: carbohydrate ABC transporter permease [Chloroflexi bacterium]|nr:carbohydrate ABC transporter permease [Chloroflexota bacterium]